MKKIILLTAVMTAVFAAACTKNGSAVTPTAAPAENTATAGTSEPTAQTTPASNAEPAPSLDADQLNKKICEFLKAEVGIYFEPAEHCIPCPIIVDTEVSDENISIYGIFWLLNYEYRDKTFTDVSGGSFPGVIRGKLTADGPVLTEMEVVDQGSGYTESAKRIFGSRYEEFSKTISNDEVREKCIKRSIEEYAKENGLALK